MPGLGADLLKQSFSAVNIGFGVVAAVLIVGLGAGMWIYRDKFRDVKALLTLAALLAMIPMGARLIQERTNLFPRASEKVRIVAVEVQKTGANKAVVYLTLSDPGFAYGEYTDAVTRQKKTIVARGKVEKRVGHSFDVEFGSQGGEMVFVVDGEAQLWLGQPVMIK